MNDSQSGVKEMCQQRQREKFQKCITSERAQKMTEYQTLSGDLFSIETQSEVLYQRI